MPRNPAAFMRTKEIFNKCRPGINRFFHMACIYDKFTTTSGKKNISSKPLWEHLAEMYNLEALNELENLPFPNEQNEFTLPDEIINPGISAPPSPATSTEEIPVALQRPTNLKLSTLQSLSAGSTPEGAAASPKRKRNRGPYLTSSQPSSPAPGTPGTKRRR